MFIVMFFILFDDWKCVCLYDGVIKRLIYCDVIDLFLCE